MKYYPEKYRVTLHSNMTLRQFLMYHNSDHDKKVVEYYDTLFSLNDLLDQADEVAKSLAALGVKEGDRLPSFLRSTPAFLIVLLAVEQIGATLICRDNTLEENLEAVQAAGGPVMFAHDYLTKEEEAQFYNIDTLKHIVLVSPYTHAQRDKVPDYVADSIATLYSAESACDQRSIKWEDFCQLGRSFSGDYLAEPDSNRPLYHPYTSGSTGPSKEIVHTAATMVGVLTQLVIPTPIETEWRCLLTLLPPALIAMVVPVILYRVSTTDLLILDPFCEEKDVDLEFMRYRPNQMIAVPMMADLLRLSKRIPEDYNMDFLVIFGGGAESMHNKWLDKIQQFLRDHHSQAVFSMGYGLSEAGSVVCVPHADIDFRNCAAGIPMQYTVVSIFAPGTQDELDYGEIGEICVSSPSLMVGYNGKPEATAAALQVHADGLTWLHTGDYGYMNENGELFTLSRGINSRYGGGPIFLTDIENRVVEVPGVDDCFIVIVKDKAHPGYFLPYMYLVLDAGVTVDDVKDAIYAVLKPHEYPLKIQTVAQREYFHFKTNRRILAAQLLAEQE